MYFIVYCLPVAAVIAALQVYLCKKSEKKAVRLIPLFVILGIIATIIILLSEPVSTAIGYGMDSAIFAFIVLLGLTAFGCAIGTGAGWIIYKIIKKHN